MESYTSLAKAAKFEVGNFLLLLPRGWWVIESAYTVKIYSSALLSLRKFSLEFNFESLSHISEFTHM